MPRQAVPWIILAACVVAACSVSRASPLWPDLSVASVVGAKQGKCDDRRRQNIEKTLRLLTLGDFYNWRMACNCQPMTLRQVLHDTQGDDTQPRNALYVVLRAPVSVKSPGLLGKPDPRPVRELVIERTLSAHAKDTTVFFGRARPPKLQISAAVVYEGWGLKGDPFALNAGECTAQ